MRLDLVVALACATGALACSAILGLQEPTVDNTLEGGGDSGGGDSPSEGTTGDGGGGATQLFNARVKHIAIDDTSVYFTEQFDLVVGKIGKDGTGQVALANGTAVAGSFPGPISVDATDVFWASSFGLHQCAKAGCANAPIHLVDESTNNTFDVGDIGLDTSFVYFVAYDQNTQANSLCKVPKGAANGTVTTVVAASKLCPTINYMHVAGNYMYVTCDEGPVQRADVTTGNVETLTVANPPPSASAFVTNTSSLFYTQFIEQSSVFQVPLQADAGGSPIALTQAYPNGIDVDPQYLYWANVGVTLDNGGGSIVRCSLSQCSSTVQTLTSSVDVPTDVKVDTTSIFFTAFGNGETPHTGVWKMPRPQ